MDHSEIANLVNRAASGDNDAFAELYDNTFDRFYFSALKTLRSPEDAADIVQEAMVDIYKNLHKLKNAQAFVAYANRVIYGKSIDLLRSRKKWTLIEDITLPEAEETNDDFLPESYVESREKQQQVLDAIDTLSDNLRVIIIMYYYNQMSTPEIADILNIQENAVRTRLSRARAQLKKALEEKEEKGGRMFMPVFALGKILETEAAALDTAAVKSAVWQSVSEAVGITAAGGSGAAASSVSSSAGNAPGSAAAISAKTAVAVKAVVSVAAAAAIITGTVLFVGRVVSGPGGDNVSVPPAISQTLESEAPSVSEPPVTASPDPVESVPVIVTESPITESPAPPPVESQAPLIAYFTVKTSSLTYPVGTELTDGIILNDSGAAAFGSSGALEVIALGEVDTSEPGEYYVYIRIPDSLISGVRQKVITITITE